MGRIQNGICFRRIVLFALVCLLELCRCENPDEVVFYEDSFYEGDRLFISMAAGCYNMDSDWNNRVSSVDTQGKCITAFDSMDCRGPSMELAPGVRGLGDLKRIKFDNIISSISHCSKTKSSSTGGSSADRNRQSQSQRSESDSEITRIGVEEHNRYRRLHGVPDLKGDPMLHRTAQSHAEYLTKNNKFETSRDGKYGENLATSYRSDPNEAVRDVVKRWYDKIELFDFRNPESNKNRPKSGQFSSMIWKSTTHMGIGMSWSDVDRKWIVVALYDPAARQVRYKENVPPPLRQIRNPPSTQVRTSRRN